MNIRLIEGVKCERVPHGAPIRATDFIFTDLAEKIPVQVGKSLVGKLADGKHMRMSGYPGKVKSLSWSAKGRWLASSGAPAAVVWPFQAKDGPMGKAPLELGTRGDAMVTCVACHPSQEVVAIGYEDGMVLASRFADQKEVLLRRPGKGAITAMAWDSEERRIVFGSAAGDCGVIDIAG